jgi:glutamate N-acetyltransferase/amino-acid N-acetyltransferase
MKIRVRRVPIRVPGYLFGSASCGLKEDARRDIGLILSEVPAAAAAAFTKNRVKAAPVVIGADHVADGRLQAVIVNSGNANAYTGTGGLRTARRMCELVARECGIGPRLVLPSSTGRIALPLPLSRVSAGVRAACRSLSRDGFHHTLDGIMTTDAFPKFAVEHLLIDGREVTVAGMAKGAGMVGPRLALSPQRNGHATTLAYVMTDAVVTPAALRRALRIAQEQSFNVIIVDGDMSTNDSIVLLANGIAGNDAVTGRSRAFPALCAAVTRVLTALARMVVKDGEGATKVIDVRVRGARSAADARRAAEAIGRSPLCKTAFFGGDPYAGRIVCAVGYSGAVFDPAKLDVFFDDVQVVRRGVEVVARVEKRAHAVVRKPEFTLTVHLHAGRAVAHRIVSDLSVEYVRFNSEYRT